MELTGLMWWMKAVSSRPCRCTKKDASLVVPSSQDILLQRQLSTPGQAAGAVLQGPANLPAPRSLILGHSVPPLPRPTPLANHHTPNMPGVHCLPGHAGRFRASSTALSELDPQIRKPSHKKKQVTS